jgi:dienelactone hydrolase
MRTRNAAQLTIARQMTATHELPDPAVIREEVVRFGPNDELVGVLSHSEAASGTAVLILNAGVLHRVGPHRLHVLLARRLAERGLAALRLDLGGIGDSVASTDAATFRESAVADTRLAMSGVAARRHVLFGVCAGADNALATALVDDRVAAIVLVDPYAYPNRRATLRALRAKITRQGPREMLRWGLGAARRRIRHRLERLRDRNTSEPQTGGREAPPIASYRMQLQALVERGVKILAIYSGSHGTSYNHEDQLFELFPELRGKVDRAYFPHANHTFTELDTQSELIGTVATWIARLP